MDITQSVGMLVSLIGGLGLFLFGMNLMGDGLEKAAGNRLSHIIERMTDRLGKGILAGLLVTALIQSSSATTVMVVGFVNAGIMKLSQAVGVIMGANVGTTVTAQLLSLSDISGNAWYLAMLKPANFAPILIGLGVIFVMFSKNKTYNHIGSILCGFAMIFIGMSTMEGAVAPLRDLPQFQRLFQTLTNPILGLLTGMAVTAIIQSSSASIGILQAATSTGTITFAAAAPIILGQNIGTCITAMLSAVGANRNAKRAAVIHLFYNIIAVVVFMIVLYAVKGMLPFWNDVIGKSGVANFHLVFNLVEVLAWLPFTKFLVKLANRLIKDEKKEEEEDNILDSRFLQNPPIAVEQARKATIDMALLACENYSLCRNAIVDHDFSVEEALRANEEKIDAYESNIGRYLMSIVDEELNTADSKKTSNLFHVLIDIERIGDRCLNLFNIAKDMHKDGVVLSDRASQGLCAMVDAVKEMLSLAVTCYDEMDINISHKITTYEHVVDEMRQYLRMGHLSRMARQECGFDAAIVYLDMASNLERISDHCANIATSVEQLMSDKPNFDPHKDPKAFQKENPQEYTELYRAFEEKYRVRTAE